MTIPESMPPSGKAPSPHRFFPRGLYPGWLGVSLSSDLLTYAVGCEGRFKPSEVRDMEGKDVASDKRVSLVMPDLGDFAVPLRQRARDLAPDLVARFGMNPFAPDVIELELAAHGDGARFDRHVDTMTGAAGTVSPRRITMVYYLHSNPKRFSGGQLRYHALTPGGFADIEPAHDLLLAFPAFAPHSVTPVACPGVPFHDWRFAVNIWVHG